MKLAQNLKGISKLAFLLFLAVFFLLGTIVSYIWTMGFYAPGEFNLPSRPNIVIEKVQFFANNATFFNVTVLNPSYSPSNVTIEKIKVETSDGRFYDTVTPGLPVQIARNSLRTFRSFWNLGNYTGQTVRVHVLSSEGLGSNLKAMTPFMNFTVISVNFDPSVSARHFNITVQNGGSSTFVNITKILVNGGEVPAEPALTAPYGLTNASDAPPVTFMLNRSWVELQDNDVSIAVQTLQGYTAYQAKRAPGVSLSIISPIVFNASYPSNFSISILNERSIPAYVDISEVEVDVFVNGNINRTVLLNSTYWTADPSKKIDLSKPLTLTRLLVSWDWSYYLGKGATATITVRTRQGFETRPLSGVNIP